MRSETQALLGQFENCHWFALCGKAVSDRSFRVVTKYLDAMRHFDSGELESIGYLNGAALAKSVREQSDGDPRLWQAAEAELRPLARGIVLEKVQPLRERKQWSPTIDMILDYDISYALLETEFDLIAQHVYFRQKAHWYLQGHVPCGITGKGRWIVY